MLERAQPIILNSFPCHTQLLKRAACSSEIDGEHLAGVGIPGKCHCVRQVYGGAGDVDISLPWTAAAVQDRECK